MMVNTTGLPICPFLTLPPAYPSPHWSLNDLSKSETQLKPKLNSASYPLCSSWCQTQAHILRGFTTRLVPPSLASFLPSASHRCSTPRSSASTASCSSCLCLLPIVSVWDVLFLFPSWTKLYPPFQTQFMGLLFRNTSHPFIASVSVKCLFIYKHLMSPYCVPGVRDRAEMKTQALSWVHRPDIQESSS